MRGIVKRVLAIAATGILTLGAVAVTGSPASASVKVMCDSGYDGTQYSFYCDLTVTPASDEVWTVGGTHLSAYDGDSTVFGTCSLGSHYSVSVTYLDGTETQQTLNVSPVCKAVFN